MCMPATSPPRGPARWRIPSRGRPPEFSALTIASSSRPERPQPQLIFVTPDRRAGAGGGPRRPGLGVGRHARRGASRTRGRDGLFRPRASRSSCRMTDPPSAFAVHGPTMCLPSCTCSRTILSGAKRERDEIAAASRLPPGFPRRGRRRQQRAGGGLPGRAGGGRAPAHVHSLSDLPGRAARLIEGVRVASGVRSQGVGKALIEWAIARARSAAASWCSSPRTRPGSTPSASTRAWASWPPRRDEAPLRHDVDLARRRPAANGDGYGRRSGDGADGAAGAGAAVGAAGAGGAAGVAFAMRTAEPSCRPVRRRIECRFGER